MPETTVEKPKFHLLEAILDLLDGKIDNNKMKEVLESARASLDEIMDNFEKDNAGLEAPVREATVEESTAVRKFFRDWENAFSAIEKYFGTGQKFDLISAGELVKRSSEGLNVAMDFYTNKALQAMGPTDIPRLNLLIRTVEEVKDGKGSDKLAMVTNDEFLTVDGARQELEFERKLFQFPEQELLIEAYGKLRNGLVRMFKYVKENSMKDLEEGLQDCTLAYPEIKSLIPKVNYKRMVQAPTQSPMANLLINMIVALRKGSINDFMFTQTLKETEEEFRKVRNRFDLIPAQQVGAYEKEVEKAGKGMELFQEALEDCYVFLESREGLFLEQAEKYLKESAEILKDSLTFFEELAEREGKTPCVRCGQYNHSDRKTCEKCGAILPKAADASTKSSTFEIKMGEKSMTLGGEEDETIPENLEKMFIAVNKVAEEEISQEEFESTVEWLRGVMEKHKSAGFAPIPAFNKDSVAEDEKELAASVLEDTKAIKALFEEGYRDWEEGLEYFLEFLDTQDKSNLEKGVQVMWEGNKKLNQLKKIASKMTQAIEEHAGKKSGEETMSPDEADLETSDVLPPY
jgi:hypothetical protein